LQYRLLTSSDDEQLPETPGTVSSVPQQELAILAALAIASLIDDDPDAPF